MHNNFDHFHFILIKQLVSSFAKSSLFPDERDLAAPGKRFPDIVPLPTPAGKPTLPFFMRPALPRAQPAVAFAPMPALKLKLNTGLTSTKQGSGSQSTHAAQTTMSPPSVAPPQPTSMSPPDPK